MNDENKRRLNRLKERILNLEKGVSLIEIRLKSAYNNINPNSKNSREQEKIQQFIETTEKSLKERKFELLQLNIEYNSEYNRIFNSSNQNSNNLNAKMEGDKENPVTETNISKENIEDNNLVKTAKIGEVETNTDKEKDINPIDKGSDVIPTDKTEVLAKTIQSSTGTIPKIIDHSSHIKTGTLKFNIPLPDLNPQDPINPYKIPKRLGPFDNFLEKSKLKPMVEEQPKLQHGTPIKYDDFSNNLIFGKDKYWVPNKSFEYRTGTNIENDYQGLYENKLPVQNPILKKPKSGEFSTQEMDNINKMFESMQPNIKINDKLPTKQTERDTNFEDIFLPEAKKEEVSMNVTFDPRTQTTKNDVNKENIIDSKNIKDSFNIHREKFGHQ